MLTGAAYDTTKLFFLPSFLDRRVEQTQNEICLYFCLCVCSAQKKGKYCLFVCLFIDGPISGPTSCTQNAGAERRCGVQVPQGPVWLDSAAVRLDASLQLGVAVSWDFFNCLFINVKKFRFLSGYLFPKILRINFRCFFQISVPQNYT